MKKGGAFTGETILTLNQQVFESIIKLLEAAESETEVDDVDTKFNLHFYVGEVGMMRDSLRGPRGNHFIVSAVKLVCGREVASRFGYSSEQFGLQLSLERMVSFFLALKGLFAN